MKTSLLVATLLRADDVRVYEVRRTPDGWESSARENQRIVEARHHTEWHRVERSLARFKHEITVFQARGWRLVSLEGSAGDMHAQASGAGLPWCCGDTRCPSIHTSASEPAVVDCPVRALNLVSDFGAWGRLVGDAESGGSGAGRGRESRAEVDVATPSVAKLKPEPVI